MHALEEVWRVVEADCWLLDIRPMASNPPLELVFKDEIKFAGAIDDSAWVLDEELVNDALEIVFGRGDYVKESVERFKLSTYWDTLDEFTSWADENWEDVLIPENTLINATKIIEQDEREPKIRLTYTMLIGRYRKS